MKTFLFDFDGTLVDSMPTWGGVMKRILDETKTKYGDDIIKIITPLGNEGTAEYYIDIGCPLSKEEILDLMAKYMVKEYTYNVPAKKNVKETLKELKSRGDSLNVLTASSHRVLDPCLKRLGIFDIFDNVWSCDDFRTTKTDPEIYKSAAKRLGKDVGDIIFIDDNLRADQTAKAAGMCVYGIFDESSAEYESEIRAETDAYIYDFAELLNM